MPDTPRAIAAVETVWEALRDRHPELPEVTVVIDTSGARHMLGRPDGRIVGEGVRPELPVHVDTIRDGPQAVFEHLIHVATHAMCEARGLSETSNRGRRHNKLFAFVAEDLGGKWPTDEPPHPVRGYSPVPMQPAALEAAAPVLDALKSVLPTNGELEDLAPPPPTGRSGRRLHLACGCGRTLQMGPRVYSMGAVTCGVCGEDFTEKN